MTQTTSPQGMGGPFANIYNKLGLAWWVEIKTQEPECLYYFGPFLTSSEAQTAMPGYIQDLDYQQQLWSDYQAASEIIVYCGSGVTACVNLLSLELAGFSNTKLYPGGWSDFISYQ